MATNTMERPSFVKSLMATTRTEENGDAEPRDAFKDAGARARETLSLDIRLNDGRRAGGPYTYLQWIDYDGGSTITLEWPGREYVIVGKRLRELYEGLLDHRVKFIQEGAYFEEGLKPDDAPHIESIRLRTAEEKEQEKQDEIRRRKSPAR